MAKDNAMTIGNPVGHTGVRDAIHSPIISAVAKEDMRAGCQVALNDALEATPAQYLCGAIGVIDPYLARDVKAGEKVWVMLRPGSISSLTHRWTHPLIKESEAVIPETERARIRLEEFAEKILHVSLEEMLETIENCRHGGDPLYDHGYEGESEYAGFWADYETYTGKTDPNKDEGFFYFFTCGGCS